MIQNIAPGPKSDRSRSSRSRYSRPETRRTWSRRRKFQSSTIIPLSVSASLLPRSAARVSASSTIVTSTGADGATTSPPRRPSCTASSAVPAKKWRPRMVRKSPFMP